MGDSTAFMGQRLAQHDQTAKSRQQRPRYIPSRMSSTWAIHFLAFFNLLDFAKSNAGAGYKRIYSKVGSIPASAPVLVSKVGEAAIDSCWIVWAFITECALEYQYQHHDSATPDCAQAVVVRHACTIPAALARLCGFDCAMTWLPGWQLGLQCGRGSWGGLVP